jgi:IS4 transposase
MYHRTLFSTLVKPLDRGIFADFVKARESDKYGKTFKSWQHLVGMLFCQFSGAASLREAVTAYSSHMGSHYHLHLPELKRSTLSQANNVRSPELFKDVAGHLLGLCRPLNRELDSVLRLIDSSPIIVKGRGNQWTKTTRCARIDGLKLHLMLEPAGKAVDYVEITPAKINDITAAADIPLEADKVYVFDKGYCDYNWWKAIADKGSVFVTRLKKNAAYKVTQTHAIADEDKGFILKDQTIVLTTRSPRGGKTNHLAGIPLRLIEVAREGKAPLILVCNDLEKTPALIAGHYKARWQIELFFKWLKRYLNVKTFLGESENSIKIQLYTAIIAYLLLWLWRQMNAFTQHTLTHLRVVVQATLFSHPETERCRKERREIKRLSSAQLQMALS